MTDVSHARTSSARDAASALSSAFQLAGFVALGAPLAVDVVLRLRSHLDDLCNRDGPERVVEPDGSPYSVYVDAADEHIDLLARSAALLPVAELLLGGPVYVYQCKANPKAALHGSELDWHQDFAHWQQFDHVPAPDALTAAILLDEVDSHLAGPLLLARGTHRSVLPIAESSVEPGGISTVSGTEVSWSSAKRLGQSTVVSPLRFRVPDHVLAAALSDAEITPVLGPLGTVVFFHANLLHAANRNLSARPRRMLFVTYNRVSNIPTGEGRPRERFIVNPDNRALLAV